MATLKKRFLEFDKDHPEVYRELRRLSLDLRKRGMTHYGVSALWEVMRYNFTLENPTSAFKFPNNHRAYYARKLMLLEPKLDGFFTLCQLRSGERELVPADFK